MIGGVIIPDRETAKALNDLARHKAIVRILNDIRMDMEICEIEGWDKSEYLNLIRRLIGKDGKRMNEEKFKQECEAVKALGDQIGYGNMMTIASALWAKMLIDEGWGGDSGAFYPTILSNMKPGDLTVHAMTERTTYLQMFKRWGW